MVGDYTDKIKNFYNSIADKRDGYKKKNQYYYKNLENLLRFIIPPKKKILEIGCGTGDLLSNLKPSDGTGIDIADKMIKIAQKKYPKIRFITSDAQNLKIQSKYDFIIMSDLIGNLEDIQKTFEQLPKVSDEQTRIVITHYNFLWEPFLLLSRSLGLSTPKPNQNWLSAKDVENLATLSGLEIIKKGTHLLLPTYIPFISNLLNKYLARLPLVKNLCLVQYFIARITPINLSKEYSVSVIIPIRNEEGNIEDAVSRIPNLGSSTELIFVENGSKDNSFQKIKEVAEKYKDIKKISYYKVHVDGKGDTVRFGFDKASSNILMILDGDLTMPPEELPKYYQALREGKGEFVMGSRLIYPMEKDAMRILNIFGNKFFSTAFSFLLDQPIKDTLCGTKAMFKNDYEQLVKNRSYFGNFDPFGDFDLIFGASKLNLKIIEIPIRYKARTYGTTNISRFKHGWLLLKMTLFAARKLKFIL